MSLETQFSTLIGFTNEELRENYIDVIKLYCEEDYIETELNNIKFHYYGYKFNVSETENRVFSPVSVIRHLASSLRVLLDIKQKKNAKNQGNVFLFLKILIYLFIQTSIVLKIIGLAQAPLKK